MKALRHITGILLATIGLTFVVGAITFILKPDPEIQLWVVGAVFVVLGLLPLAGAFALLRAKITTPGCSCPQCGGSEQQPAGILRTSHNSVIFPLSGWLVSSLWGASRQKQVRCAQCETLYMTDPRFTRIAGILLWVFILFIVLGIIAQQFEGR